MKNMRFMLMMIVFTLMPFAPAAFGTYNSGAACTDAGKTFCGDNQDDI